MCPAGTTAAVLAAGGSLACPTLAVAFATCPLPVPREQQGKQWLMLGYLSAFKLLKHPCRAQQPALHTKSQVSREQIWSETFLPVTDTNTSLLMMLKAFRLCRAVTCTSQLLTHSVTTRVSQPGSHPSSCGFYLSRVGRGRAEESDPILPMAHATAPGMDKRVMPQTWRSAK